MRSSNTNAKPEPISVFAATLAGAPPTMRAPLSPTAVRRHSLDDSGVKRPSLTVAPATRLPGQGATPAHANGAARGFTAADRELIRKVHGYMAPLQLLGILNTRLTCDLGGGPLYTIEQLHAELANLTSAVPAGGNDWATLRKILAKAKRAGMLDLITEEVINDFAIVYSLNQKQVLTLKDILLAPEDEEE